MLRSIYLIVLSSIIFGDVALAQFSGGPASANKVSLTHRTIQHIIDRHWPNSPAEGAGKFLPGVTEDSLRQMIDESVANGQVRPNTNGRAGEIFEYDFQRAIGTGTRGEPATRLRVVVSPRNKVVTAFPF
ncbi:MAG: hypothetical protein JOY96_07690 [Verrucomicrobia bacterium]|nr:hypothetical protein [Verrucomicrobiota bacterium]MBV9671891.1 hypothetical protein [Verrucomicrobiota bacterium]